MPRPALFTRTSSPPSASTTRSTPRSTSSSSRTSIATPMQPGPSSRATAAARSGFRPVIATAAPASSRAAAIPAPRPLVPPVMSTRTPGARKSSVTPPTLAPRAPSASGGARRQESQPVRWALLDEPPQRRGVGVLLDEVAEPVQPRLAHGRELGAGRGDEPPSRRPGDLGQEGPAEAVVLQRPVPRRPPHRAGPAAVQERVLRPVVGDDAVVDLVALDGVAQRRTRWPAQRL